MRFQRSDDSWIVLVKKREFPLAMSRSNVEPEFAIGTINDRTGAIQACGLPYGLATQSRSRPDPAVWEAAQRVALQKAVESGALDKARREYRREEKGTGSFHVVLSDGSRNSFHEYKRASEWAEKQLERLRPGARAEFYRDNSPNAKAVGAFEKNAYGIIKHAAIDPRLGIPSERRRHGNRRSRR
jgi:hypothetical protein